MLLFNAARLLKQQPSVTIDIMMYYSSENLAQCKQGKNKSIRYQPY